MIDFQQKKRCLQKNAPEIKNLRQLL